MSDKKHAAIAIQLWGMQQEFSDATASLSSTTLVQLTDQLSMS
jgi:hypothetical protein